MNICRIPFVAIFLCLEAGGIGGRGRALGQFKLDIEKVADEAFRDQDVHPANQARVIMDAPLRGLQIESLIFRPHRSRAEALKALQNQLTENIDKFTRDCDLSGEQQAQLTLAGEVDMARFIAQCDVIVARSGGKIAANFNQNDLNEILKATNPLQRKLQHGLFDDGSLFQRALKSGLNPDQRKQVEELERQRSEFQLMAIMKQLIAKLEREAPLRSSQRDALMQLLYDPMELPLVVDKPMVKIYATYRFAQLEPKLKEILNQHQMEAVRPVLARARAYERTLRSRGLIK